MDCAPAALEYSASSVSGSVTKMILLPGLSSLGTASLPLLERERNLPCSMAWSASSLGEYFVRLSSLRLAGTAQETPEGWVRYKTPSGARSKLIPTARRALGNLR